MNNLDHISLSLETIFWVKIFKFFDADPGLKNSDPGSATDFPQEFALTGGFVVEYVSGLCCFGIGQDQR
jgi:hypothetical protein